MSLKQDHYIACYKEGMTDKEIEEDWKVVEAELAAYYETLRRHCERPEAESINQTERS